MRLIEDFILFFNDFKHFFQSLCSWQSLKAFADEGVITNGKRNR